MFSRALNTMAEWLAKQQTQTVVMILWLLSSWAVVYGLAFHAAPWLVKEMQGGYERQEVAHEKQIKLMIDVMQGRAHVDIDEAMRTANTK